MKNRRSAMTKDCTAQAALRGVRRQRGVTMIEMLTVISVAAILASIAIPSFRTSIARSRLTTVANDYVAALSQARSEAVRRNVAVQFCGSSSTENGSGTLGTSCDANLGHVYAFDPANVGTAIKIVDTPVPSGGVTVDYDGGDVPALRYGGQGFAHRLASSAPYSGLVADISTTRLDSENHRCIYLITGSAISTCSLSEACPTDEPANCQ